MSRVVPKTATEEEFFRRGRALARLADAAEPIPEEHRDRSAVKRNVDRLARGGTVTVEDKVLPGHGRLKEVRSAARLFRLEAVLASRRIGHPEQFPCASTR